MSTAASILEEIRQIGLALPGTLETVYTVCGKPGCRCQDKQHPQKHGPYYRLSYSLAGRNSSMFVKQDDVEDVRKMVDNYKKLRALILDLALTTLDSVKQSGVAQIVQQAASGCQNVYKSGSSWKDKCRKRARLLKAAIVKIRDLSDSRDKWREECLELRSKIKVAKRNQRVAQDSETKEGGKK